MKQDMRSDTESAGKSAPSKKSKPQRNLYEPYSTPDLFWSSLRFAARILIFLTMRVRLKGRYNVPRRGPYIIAANHLSWTDIPLIPAFLPSKVVFMAKEESFHSKVGWLVRFLGAFPVRRHEADRQAIRAAGEQLKQGKIFFIFPEGTRSLNHKMARGYAGLGMIALRAEAPVVPVAIWGSENALKKLGAEVHISFGEPIHFKPKGAKATREDIEFASEETMRRIAAMLPERYRGVYGEEAQEQAQQ
jgi:1-acyl-sn-glycerol-3-phosphate acyltransferase